mgnify:CR=1 FL=1
MCIRDSFWPGENPIGHRVSWGFDENEERIWVTIVGIVGDIHVEGLDLPPRPETYLPFAQDPFTFMTLILRTGDDPASFAPALRRAVKEIDPNQPVNRIKTMDAILVTELAQRRFNMLLMGTFAGVAVLLVAVGLYGMLSFSISRRRHEIGIRRALGALPGDIAAQFVRDGLRMMALGLGIGLAATLVVARFLSAQLHGIRATDPLTYLIAALVLIGVGLFACYLPARRAARVEPMTVLRTE